MYFVSGCPSVFKQPSSSSGSSGTFLHSRREAGVGKTLESKENILVDALACQDESYAIEIISQTGKVLSEITYCKEEFTDFCSKFQEVEKTAEKQTQSFWSISARTARVNTISEFVKTFFFPTTTLYSNKVPFFLTVLWDLLTVVCRIFALPVTFYEMKNSGESSVLQAFKKLPDMGDINPHELQGPYVDIHFHMKVFDGPKKIELQSGKRLFFRKHTKQENTEYFFFEGSSPVNRTHFEKSVG